MVPLSCSTPKIHLNYLLSKIHNDLYLLLDAIKFSEEHTDAIQVSEEHADAIQVSEEHTGCHTGLRVTYRLPYRSQGNIQNAIQVSGEHTGCHTGLRGTCQEQQFYFP
jgi:hypothetical protein